MPLDMDVSVLVNDDCRKERVGFTYHKVNGYAPIFATLGTNGFQLANELRPGRFRASCDEILMAEIGPNASGGTENPLGKTETGTRKATSRPTAPNQSVMAAPTCQRRRNLHGFRFKST